MPNVILYGAIAGAATMLGAAIPMVKKWSRSTTHWVMAFAAGVLLGAAFLHVIPEALEKNVGFAQIGIVASFLVIFAIEQTALIHTCAEYDEQCEVHQMGLMAAGALFFHSLVDGLAIASGFNVSVSLGLITSFAVISHEFPEGLTTASLLLATGHSRSRTLLYALAVSLATPIGAIIAFSAITNISDQTIALILGIAAGSFVYVGASDILPRVHHTRNVTTLLFFVVGLAVVSIPLLFEI
ncbi:MAG: ZIP family metal transporter [Terriglobia bacterium]